tara:strand:- start:445 stop:723 length:279 start_codon:yes stop_codon:yes gene_type:complete
MDVINENTKCQNAKEEYKTLGIIQYENQIKNLIREKHEYMQKIDNLQHSIRLLEEKKSFFCHSMGGHKWITEREGGLYGETYSYCEKCKKEC